MGTPFIEEISLPAFKSFVGATFPLSDLTVLIGRNGSGKSNVLDALEVLSRLSTGDDLRESLEGRAGLAPPVRGGAEGCAPAGTDTFELGCRVDVGGVLGVVEYALRVRVSPDVQVVSERLVGQFEGRDAIWLASDPPEPHSADITARYRDGKRGTNPSLAFRSTRLLLSQVATRIPETAKGVKPERGPRLVHEAARAVLAAMSAVEIIDPVPARMRDFVARRDDRLRRHAENLSAAAMRLRDTDAASWDQLVAMVTALPEQEIMGVSFADSSLGDVMIELDERINGREVPVPARQLSDGMLRFIAVLVALLLSPRTDAEGQADGTANRALVVEEIENGLHPSQAAAMVELLREESTRRRVRTLVSTHSPALLTALQPADHEHVVVCDRAPDDGRSRLRVLTRTDAYAAAMAKGTLGEAVTSRRLDLPVSGGDESLRDLLGVT